MEDSKYIHIEDVLAESDGVVLRKRGDMVSARLVERDGDGMLSTVAEGTGGTIEEALANLEDSVEVYLENYWK